jgi:hypothetical protein
MPQLDFDGANSKISADKIQGQSGTTVTIPAGHSLVGDGSGLTGVGGGLVHLTTVTISNDSTVDIDGFFSSSYDVYFMTFTDVIAVTNGNTPRLRVMVASTIKTDATGYMYTGHWVDTSSYHSKNDQTGVAQFRIGGSFGDQTGEQYNGQAWIYNPLDTSNYFTIHTDGHCRSSSAVVENYSMTGQYKESTSAVSGVSFYASASNLTSGTVSLYGLAKA